MTNFIRHSIPYIISVASIFSIAFLVCELVSSDTKEERVKAVFKTLIMLIVLIIGGIILMDAFNVIAAIVVVCIVLIVFAGKY